MSSEEGQTPEQIQIENDARLMGWVDKTEFRGPENEWSDAETFVKRGREINPILRENNKRLLIELEKAKKEINDIRKTAEEFKTFQKEAFERKLEDFKSKIETLKAAKKEALQEGDHDLVVEIDDQISDTKDAIKSAKEPHVVKETTNTEALDPELQAWVDRNPWFGKDLEISQRTNTIGALIAQRNPGLHGKPFLDKLDEELKKEFPDKFGNPNREKPNPVEGGGPSGTKSSKGGKHSFDNLPPEAQQACRKFVKQKLMTEEQYLADYQWDD